MVVSAPTKIPVIISRTRRISSPVLIDIVVNGNWRRYVIELLYRPVDELQFELAHQPFEIRTQRTNTTLLLTSYVRYTTMFV